MLVKYLVEIADMGCGLTRKTVMELAFTIVQKSERKISFAVERLIGHGSRDFDGATHSYLYELHSHSLTAEPFLPTMQQLMTVFGKLGSLYGRLNLISKPMLIYNCDETDVSIVHKPGKVVTEMGRRNVYALTSAERGKTHRACLCISFWVCPPNNDNLP